MRSTLQILLVGDGPAEVDLMQEAFRDGGIAHRTAIVTHGTEALRYLRREPPFEAAIRPDLIVFDLGPAKSTSHQAISQIKGDPELSSIPVVVLTGALSELDIQDAYSLHANCVITKPGTADEYFSKLRNVGDFWLRVVRLPNAHL